MLAIDSVEARLEVARGFGAVPVHLTEESPRDVVRKLTEGRGVDAAIDAVGHPDALDLAIRLARKAGTVVAIGVYAEPCQVHMGVVWIKGLTLRTGQANVIGHVDRVLGMLAAGTLDPTPLVTHHMSLDDAPEGYAIYDRREALKIVLRALKPGSLRGLDSGVSVVEHAGRDRAEIRRRTSSLHYVVRLRYLLRNFPHEGVIRAAARVGPGRPGR